MTDEIAISVNSVSKNFKLPHERADSVKSLFINPFNKNRKKFESQHTLRNISFDIKKGEFFGIVGRNGSGKSTLLKIIAGIYQPNKGNVSINGRLVPFIELGVGFNPELTGRENVYLNGALLGFSEKEVDNKFSAIVEFAELERFMDQKLKNFSSGMQVRLAFSVATILAESDILLIDEVLAVGDADFQRKCFNYFRKLKKDKKTVIFVTHDMDAVREYCDRAAFIEDSKLVEISDPDSIAQRYTKLFMENTDKEVNLLSADEKRWGLGIIKTRAVKIELTDYTIKIKHTIKSTDYIDGFVAGIRIRSASGVGITGTNSKLERIKLGSISAENELNIEWSLPNVLADGRYYVDAAINGLDGVEVYDWWDEAASISIKKDRAVPYLIDPGFKVNIIKGD